MPRPHRSRARSDPAAAAAVVTEVATAAVDAN